jgi:hypothetical protein
MAALGGDSSAEVARLRRWTKTRHGADKIPTLVRYLLGSSTLRSFSTHLSSATNPLPPHLCGRNPYNVDKLLWFIGSGYFYDDLHVGKQGRTGSQKKEFIEVAREKLEAGQTLWDAEL